MSFLTSREISRMAGTATGVANARLTKIADTPTLDTSGDPTGDGPVLWTGSVRGYLEREESTDMLGSPISRNPALIAGLELQVNLDTFTILDAAGAPLLERPGPEWRGTTVTIEDDRTTPASVWTFRVKDLRHDAYGTLDSTVMLLEKPKRIS